MVGKLRAWRFDWLWIALCASALVGVVNAADEPPRVLEQVKVYSEPGRFAGWPANHGIWSWGDEVLVGFSRGYDKDNGADYHIDPDRPEDFLLARSKDGGAPGRSRSPNPPGAMVGTRGMRHAAMPPGVAEERPSPLREPIDFTHPEFALAVHMEDHRKGASCFYCSYDRGKSWRGPFGLPLFGQQGVMGRTDYIVEGRHDLFAVPHGDQIRRDRRPAVFGPNDRRRAHLAIPRVHRAGTPRICRHAVDGARLADRPGDDRPPPRFSPPVDRRLRIARRRPVVVLSRDSCARHRRRGTRRAWSGWPTAGFA